MADNVVVTAGTGTTVHADEYTHATLGSGKTQLVKLVDGTLDSGVPIVVDVGVKANALRVCPANDITDATYIGDIKFGESIPAGTNAIGKLAANSGIVIGDVNLGATDNAVLDAIAASDASIDGKITACNTGAVVLATGSAAIGKLTANSGIDIGDVDVTSIISGVGATNLGKAEDAAHTSGDVGVMSLAVRFDAGGALAGTDLDYAPLQVDANGALRVTGGGGGTEYTEDVATANPIVGSAVMMERDDALSALTPIEGDWASLRCNANGALWTKHEGTITVDGTVTANLSATDNAVLDSISSDTASMLPGIQNIDTNITACNTGAVVVASGAITETNSASLAVVGGGAEATALRVTLANDSTGVITVDGTVTANLSATDNAVLDTIDADTGAIKLATEIMDDWDAVHASAASSDGPQIMGAGYSAGLPTDVGADGDAARICTDRYGRVLAGIMPQNFQATMTSADAQAATPVKTKTADKKMYILSLIASTDTALNLQFQDDTGPTVLIEGIYLAANGGFVMNWPPEAPLVVNTNEDFDVIASAAGNISVTITGYLAV